MNVDELEAMKRWFGKGEVDVDLMMRMGVLDEYELVMICNTLTDSPWFSEPTD